MHTRKVHTYTNVHPYIHNLHKSTLAYTHPKRIHTRTFFRESAVWAKCTQHQKFLESVAQRNHRRSVQVVKVEHIHDAQRFQLQDRVFQTTPLDLRNIPVGQLVEAVLRIQAKALSRCFTTSTASVGWTTSTVWVEGVSE
jgi:hypothetical protein